MASATVAVAKHLTLAASTVDAITFSSNPKTVEVCNRDGAAAIYFTVNGVDPTVGGDDCFVVAAAAGAALAVDAPTTTATVVKLISSGTPAYSVTAAAK